MKTSMILRPVVALLLLAGCAKRPVSRTDEKIGTRIQTNINFLASDELEGRRAGSAGELKAAEYIAQWFKQYGLEPKGTNGYLQPFEIFEGKEAKEGTMLAFDEVAFKLNTDFWPMPWSAQTTTPLVTTLSRATPGSAWVVDLNDTLRYDNPHFDLDVYERQTVEAAQAGGATAVLFINSGSTGNKVVFNSQDRAPAAAIPVLFLKDPAISRKVDLYGNTQMARIEVKLGEKRTTGHNVIGFINNNVPNTIVIGAHYDHLGWGMDRNSLYNGPAAMIHNGADDNASGTAALIELSGYLKSSPLKNYNFLFIAFSGEELGLFGSKYFTKNPTLPLSSINYMINMDMLGRLNPQSRALTIGGLATSPAWKNIIKPDATNFLIKPDSSGVGPSDHTSFYRENIPVLFFFTGTHADYHKPTDDADKININGEVDVVNYIKQILIATNYESKLAFTKTAEPAMGRSTFKVSLGIMPDYTYSGTGVRVDGVSDGKAAQKAGIQVGDVLVSLGRFSFTDVQSYMEALNKFQKGETSTITLMRGTEKLELPVTFY